MLLVRRCIGIDWSNKLTVIFAVDAVIKVFMVRCIAPGIWNLGI